MSFNNYFRSAMAGLSLLALGTSAQAAEPSKLECTCEREAFPSGQFGNYERYTFEDFGEGIIGICVDPGNWMFYESEFRGQSDDESLCQTGAQSIPYENCQ